LNQINIRDIGTFLKNPRPEEKYKIDSIGTFLRMLWKSIIVFILIEIIFGILIVIPLNYFNLYPSLYEIEYTPIITFKVIVLLPIIEELIFRLSLRISRINILISFCSILFLNLNKWFFSNYLLTFLCCSMLFFVIYLWTSRMVRFFNKLTAYLNNHFIGFFYLQALIFGLLHLTNYNIDLRYFYLFPLFAFSYIISGCIFGYLRVKFTYGVFLCIASHIVINGVSYLILSR
jgi:hypothetical protein